MNQKTKLSYLAVIVLALALGLASFVAVAKNDNASENSNAKNEKTVKTSESQSKGKVKDNTVDLKNFQKPDKAKGETNAQIHKEKTEEVVEELEQVAVQEETAGNTEVSEQIEEVAQEQEEIQTETAEAIEDVETRGKIKTLLIGTDYKNLGQLQSSLVHNRNQIRKLTQVANQTQNTESIAQLRTQLETLMQERERIKNVVNESEEIFSLFGWVTRFFSKYQETSIDEAEENSLTEEVETAIELASSIPTAEEAAIPDVSVGDSSTEPVGESGAASTETETLPASETTVPASTATPAETTGIVQ